MKSKTENSTYNKSLQIFADYWGSLISLFPSCAIEHFTKQVETVLKCSDPNFGFFKYMCLGYRQESRVVTHSCRSKFCLSCIIVNRNNFAKSIAVKLPGEAYYRHLVLTMPARIRKVFNKNTYGYNLHGSFMKLGYEFVKEVKRKIVGQVF